MKVKIKNYDLIHLYNTLEKFRKLENSKYFSYAVIKNLYVLANDFNILKKMYSISPEYKDLMKKREDICQKFCELNENGNPVIYKNTYSIKEEFRDQYKNEIKELLEQNKDVLKKHLENREQYNKILNEENEYDFFEVDFEYIPKEISPQDLHNISCFVKYTE